MTEITVRYGPAMGLLIGALALFAACDDGGGAAAQAPSPQDGGAAGGGSGGAGGGGGGAPDAAPPDGRPLDSAIDAASADAGADAGADASADAGADARSSDAFVSPDGAAACGPENPCPDGETCDEHTGECHAAGSCEEDADCPGARRCVDGACNEADPCFSPADCDAGRICVEGACIDACVADEDCAEGERCDVGSGRCERVGGCDAGRPCPEGQVCVAGACQDGCVENADCPGARSCDPESGRCLEPARCFADEDCDPGRSCQGGQCAEPPCVVDDDCPGGQICEPDGGECVEPPECADDVDCLGARICADDQCAEPCVEGDCPGARICDIESGRCVEPVRCDADADCLADRVCVAGACADPECVENDDCGGGACVDLACAAGPPVACDGDPACPDHLSCLAVGACVPADACAADGDCPIGAPRCAVDSGACRRCLDDADCAAAERCRDGACALEAACALDADCPGTRVCAQLGACAPLGGCDGDRFDDAPDRPELRARTYTGLVLCDDDVDGYRANIAAGEGLRIVLRHDPAEGDLRLAVLDFAAGDPGGMERVSDGPFGVERIELPARDDAREVDITVSGRPGASSEYSLTLERVRAAGCPPDDHEGLTGNDEARTAALIPLGTGAALSICPGDEDWFTLRSDAAGTLTVRATADAAVDDLIVEILDAGGDIVARAVTAGEDCVCFLDEHGEEQCDCQPDDGTRLVATADVEAGARSFIRVRGRDAQIERAVVLDLAFEPGGDGPAVCDDPLVLVAGQRLLLGEPQAFDVFTVSCGFGMGADSVARFELPAPARVSVALTGDGFNTAIAIRGDCGDEESEVACAAGEDPRIEPFPLDAGTWYVVVKGSFGPMPALDLTIE